jgi:hypothetical protein
VLVGQTAEIRHFQQTVKLISVDATGKWKEIQAHVNNIRQSDQFLKQSYEIQRNKNGEKRNVFIRQNLINT